MKKVMQRIFDDVIAIIALFVIYPFCLLLLLFRGLYDIAKFETNQKNKPQ